MLFSSQWLVDKTPTHSSSFHSHLLQLLAPQAGLSSADGLASSHRGLSSSLHLVLATHVHTHEVRVRSRRKIVMKGFNEEIGQNAVTGPRAQSDRHNGWQCFSSDHPLLCPFMHISSFVLPQSLSAKCSFVNFA